MKGTRPPIKSKSLKSNNNMEGTRPPTGASPTQPYKCGQNVKINVNINVKTKKTGNGGGRLRTPFPYLNLTATASRRDSGRLAAARIRRISYGGDAVRTLPYDLFARG